MSPLEACSDLYAREIKPAILGKKAKAELKLKLCRKLYLLRCAIKEGKNREVLEASWRELKKLLKEVENYGKRTAY